MHHPSGDGPSCVVPALLLRYGSKEPKRCRLDRDVLLLGRASTCDVALVSPDVAPLHCVIVRNGNSWRLRDCTGRRATRINGKAVHEERLCDGDIVQVGVFSFEVELPSSDLPAEAPAGRAARPC
jgi:pSer/pThr/pTyr-binding forkhead associated (FHA) protein